MSEKIPDYIQNVCKQLAEDLNITEQEKINLIYQTLVEVYAFGWEDGYNCGFDQGFDKTVQTLYTV